MEQETHLSQVGLAYDSSRILRLPFPALGGHLWGQLLEAIGGQCLIVMDQLHAWTLSPATQDLELSIRVRLNATGTQSYTEPLS